MRCDAIGWKRLFTLLFILITMNVWSSATATGPHINVQLVSQHTSLASGENWVGIALRPDPQWHTYWLNPGDSGEPPSITWTLPDGVIAGEIQWPLPEAIPVAHLVNYGYDGDTLLMVPLQVNEQFAANNDQMTITADLSWLVCKEDCIPGWATLSLQIPLTAESPQASEYASLFETTKAQLPSQTSIQGKHEITDDHIVVSFSPPVVSDNWQLLPIQSNVIEHSAKQTQTQSDQQVNLVLKQSDYFASQPEKLDFLLTDGRQGYYLTSQLNDSSAFVSGSEAAVVTGLTILSAVFMAFLGGVILNLMPCVLPILSIKALSFQQASTSGLIKLGYFLGVIASFIGFAAIIIGLKSTGQAVGWGFQMQTPWVIALLAFLFVFIALSLFDVVAIGGRLSGVGQSLVSGSGFNSQFFTGVLAVIVASPCTAPFMAAAIGIALVSEPWITILIFFSLGVGFALPLTLLFYLPGLTKRLPKPGPWMDTFKQFLAFPMLATVVWLVWVYLNQTNSYSLLILLGCLLLFSFAVWWLSKVKNTIGKVLAMSLALLAMTATMLAQTQPQDTTANQHKNSFSAARLAELRKQQQVVLVNMTADWCITCKVNEQVALDHAAFQDAISNPKVHYLVGDWTNKNEEILSYLNQYQRSGVPLYVVYAGNQSHQVLPQILTTQIVTKAIQTALGEIENED